MTSALLPLFGVEVRCCCCRACCGAGDAAAELSDSSDQSRPATSLMPYLKGDLCWYTGYLVCEQRMSSVLAACELGKDVCMHLMKKGGRCRGGMHFYSLTR